MGSAWGAVTRSKTPINLFAIAMMCCAAIFGMSATQIENANSLIAFTYTLHTFLAVSGMFFVTILFCRKGVYHPDDLAKAKRDGLSDFGEDRPVIAAVLIALMLIAYCFYHATTEIGNLLFK
jgi:ribose/xylose/arabinose/galactoside ABC-type transport system permease subunit